MTTSTRDALQLKSNDNDYQEIEIVSKKQFGGSKPEWILIKEAAELADMHIESIRRLCRKGSIECRQLIAKVSPWEVDKSSLIAYLNEDKDVGGRPHKSKGA
jgi:hypothetical protein